MAGVRLGAVLRHLQTLFGAGTIGGLADTELLERCAGQHDEAAFAALVARHGAMVLAVCRGVLRSPQDAEDAFQATFLILARKAGSLRVDDSLGGWLHRVARRVAVQANDGAGCLGVPANRLGGGSGRSRSAPRPAGWLPQGPSRPRRWYWQRRH